MSVDLVGAVSFTAVVDAGSFTGAAQTLGIPKSTVSRRVARLEEHLGVRLLQRTTRTMSLTEAGRAYYEASSHAVGELADAERAAHGTSAAPHGRLRVTAPRNADTRLSRIAESFLDGHPEVRLELDLSDRRVNMIEEGYDIAIRGGDLADSTLVARILADSQWQLMASPGYLERAGEPTSPEELAGHDCVIFGPSTTDIEWELSGPRGTTRVHVRGRLSANDLNAVRLAAVAGLGIAQLLPYGCKAELADGRLRTILPGVTGPGGRLWIVYPSRRHLSPTVRSFIDHVLEQFAPTPDGGL